MRSNNDPRGSYQKAMFFSWLLGISALTFVVIMATFPLRDYDTFWHLANGRSMVDEGRIISEEIFSFTANGTPFDNFEWLTQITFFLVYSRAGAAGLILFKAATVAISFALLMLTARLLGASWLGIFSASAVSAVSGVSRFTARPQVFSFLALTLILAIIVGYKKGKLTWRSLLAIPVIFVVWNFFHTPVYGLVLMCSVTAGAIATSAAPKIGWPILGESWRAEPTRPIIFSFAVSIALLSLGPTRLLSLRAVLGLVSNDPVFARTGEFQPTPYLDFEPFWFLLVLLIGLAVVCRKAIDPIWVVVLAPFVLLAIRYTRAVGVFSIMAMPILALMLSKLPQPSSKLLKLVLSLLPMVIAATAVCYGGYLKTADSRDSTRYGRKYPLALGVDPEFHPPGSARFIIDHDLQGNMYNTDRYGGYLAYQLFPEKKIFHFNGQPHVFKALQEFAHNPSSREQWNISYAVTAREDEIRMFESAGFVRVYWEPTAMVLVNPEGVDAKVAKEFAIALFNPLMARSTASRIASNPQKCERLAREISTYLRYRNDSRLAEILAETLIERPPQSSAKRRLTLVQDALRENSRNAHLVSAEGLMHQTLGQEDLAREKYREAISLDKALLFPRLQLGYLIYDQGDPESAQDIFARAYEQNNNDPKVIFGLALCSMRLGDDLRARVLFQEFLEIEPNGAWAETARRHIRGIDSNRE